ncbi:hypothetical protein psyc5s11_27480 [Clostridium gelidum]|uniref:Glycosyltransferase n=1 Tax=Clostridium gelidum TaxID=704125 RepID=A0ABM7T5S8_9CLOT|nr:glycosyltransferase [Clostridium gelidum]BCZ46681.1 hypothetical protein psyc5s11_27480 [Clostridium gelidum]
MSNVSIIILTYNNIDYNMQCIQSIREYTEKGTYEIVVVDNGSTDGTREWLKKQTDLKLVFPDYNTGFPKGCNLGIEAAEKENDILLLNNDIVVTPHWLNNLSNCLCSDESIGAVGPTTNYAWNNQSISVPYESIEDMIKFAETINNSDENKWEPKVKLIGFCMLIKRQVLNIIGLLDERFSPGHYEDDDLCMRIIESGYKLFQCNDCFIHHYGSATFKNEPNKFNNFIAINAQKFIEKWKFTAPATATAHENFEILTFLNEQKEKELKILQIRCGFGVTLLRAKYLYPNAKLYGIETDKNIAKISSKLIKISTKEVEDFPLEFEQSFFDYILLDDYLAYSKEPWELLKELRKYLKPGGYLIASVPNLIHYSVIQDLLKGNFIYGLNSILNRNHNCYFTYNDINIIAEECGYRKTPYIIYWSNVRSDEDEKFLNDLCTISRENMKWNFISYKYLAKFQNE